MKSGSSAAFQQPLSSKAVKLRMIDLSAEKPALCRVLLEDCQRWWMLEGPSKNEDHFPTTPRFLYAKKSKDTKDLILGMHSAYNFDPGFIRNANREELKELSEDTSGGLLSALPLVTYQNASKAWSYLHKKQENMITAADTVDMFPLDWEE
jgi:hypothetical protein